RMDNATTLGTEIVIQAAQSFAPCVAAGDCEYSVGYLLADPDEFDLDTYAARVLPDGTLGTTATLLEDPGNVYQDGMAAAGMHSENRAMFVWRSQQPVSGNDDIHAILYRPLAGSLTSFGFGCPGPAGVPTLSGSGDPHPTTLFTATLSGAPAGAVTLLGIGFVPVAIAIPGTAGCLILVVPAFAPLPGVADAAGNTSWSFPIPCDPNLDGGIVHLQGAIVVPGFNAANIVTSNRLTVSWSD
ncbi:MAG TPA: hypothetical protein VKF62_10135, partial [Planctomycetota bacterium]|nr:hypothetical protein [Planctomycetota bacterium]